MTTSVNCTIDPSHIHCSKRISWSAIATGAIIGVGLSFLLNLFGMTIGLSAFSMTEQGVGSLAIGGLLGLIISTIVSFFFGGFAAGYLGRLYVPKRNLGIVYGFTTWSVTLLLSAVVTTYVGTYVDSYTSVVTRNMVVATQEAPAASANASDKQKMSTEQKIATVNPKDLTSGMAVGAFIVFALFFVGAFSSCLGAHYGMSCRSDE